MDGSEIHVVESMGIDLMGAVCWVVMVMVKTIRVNDGYDGG